ncbi:MFS transporter, partial [Clostridium paraputrificum]|uniref:MFS transporter n=1 Tax=Clostridium paraputrificum TaxID=29363 RepID=UPI000AD7CC76
FELVEDDATYLIVDYKQSGIGSNSCRIWDAVNDPIMGLIVDNTRTKWGKFRPWILIGTLINSIVLIFLFTDCGLTGKSLYVYVSVMYILWGMTYTLMDVPYWSM